jgi:hypothetical protein
MVAGIIDEGIEYTHPDLHQHGHPGVMIELRSKQRAP